MIRILGSSLKDPVSFFADRDERERLASVEIGSSKNREKNLDYPVSVFKSSNAALSEKGRENLVSNGSHCKDEMPAQKDQCSRENQSCQSGPGQYPVEKSFRSQAPFLFLHTRVNRDEGRANGM